MKVRFNSAKERNPTQDNGLEVLYAPGKRVAFRLRWYLIVFLILLPALWLAGSYGLSLLRIEAPALVRLPTLEVNARQPGRVQHINVKEGDHVQAGSDLLQLGNPEWDLRLALLSPAQQQSVNSAPLNTLSERSLAAYQRLVERAQRRVSDVSQLVNRGAATRGELVEAQNALDSRTAEMLAFQRTLAGGGASLNEQQRYQQQQDNERKWLQGQIANLRMTASETGRITQVLAVEGQDVGPGTPLLRMERSGPAQLWVYMDPKDIEHSQPGSPLEVQMPDGSWTEARVISMAESANPLPTDLRKPFSSPTRGLMVPASFSQPLAGEWRIDSLPVRVRFPQQHFHLFGFDF